MTTYNTYQEAKIANNPSAIYKLDNGEFVTGGWIEYRNYGKHTFELCDPADYCMSMLMFYEIGLELIDGDMYQNERGIVCTVGDLGFEEQYCNNLEGHADPSKVYILKSLALKDIPTETPEEKEVLDGIDSAGEVEWKSGDIAILYGDQVLVIAYHPNHPVVVVETNDNEYLNVGISDLSKPETPQQRKDRERLEAAYDLFVCAADDGVAVNPNLKDWKSKYPSVVKMWLRVVDKTNYRKEKTHGAN
ncbi:hypothetical protein NVP1105O_71 [Vibrio phage 1.105.O._10N.286.49.B4]|nr:hypothetical protein NVP1105O_71 [Vibrio phage 1.105.O._10N.286.49.B4]